MKKLLALVLILVGLTFAQTNVMSYPTGETILTTYHAFTLASGNTSYYSSAVDVAGHRLKDSLSCWNVSYRSTDTVNVTVYLQGRKNAGNKTSNWETIGTLTTTNSYDSLNSAVFFKFGTFAATSISGKGKTLGGADFDQVRLKWTYANKTTIGDSGTLILWLTLFKEK